MHEYETFKLFLERTGCPRSVIVESDFYNALREEAKEHIKRKNYSKAVEVALDCMVEWYNNNPECPDITSKFVISHRPGYIYCCLLRKEATEKENK